MQSELKRGRESLIASSFLYPTEQCRSQGLPVAHPEGQNEEENARSLRKNKKIWSKFEEKMRKVDLLPTRDCEARGGGELPKNVWRVCAATLTTIFKPPVTEWPLFIFHILLLPNDPHFQNALSLKDPLFKKYLSVKMGVMLSLNDAHFHQ